ncbi:extracellular solute-binding protein [Treponema sp. HNW]|uniref:ABC transporter substrate-binding protein n=1 Tax=Treponema sp. HNW TaxID=3116654 RepID=UPI003D0B1C3E
MKNKLIVFFSVCLLLIPLTLTAKGSGDQGNVSGEEVTLEFWTWRTEDVEFYDKVIDAFQKKHPKIKVKQTAIKNTEYNTILSASLQGGGGPDVFMGRAYGGLKPLADSGYVLALDDLVPELKSYSEPAKSGARSVTDGKIYGLPALSQAIFCYYNKDVYNKLGLKVPTTWAEFISNLETCKKSGIVPLANGSKDGWTVETLMGGIGPNFYGANDFFNAVTTGKTTFEDPRFVEAVKKIGELRPYMPELFTGVGYTDIQGSFINEMSAHMIGGSYEAGTFKAQNPSLAFDVFPVPGEKAGTQYVTFYADMNWAVNAATKQKDAALTFLKFLGSKEVGNMIVSELKMVSSVPGVDTKLDPFVGKVITLLKNSTSYIFLVPFRYEQPTGSSLWQAAGQGFLSGSLTAEEACKKVQDGIASYYKPFQK